MTVDRLGVRGEVGWVRSEGCVLTHSNDADGFLFQSCFTLFHLS